MRLTGTYAIEHNRRRKALDTAIRNAPLLSKWPPFVQRPDSDPAVGVALAEWAAFENQFDVVRLGYESLEMLGGQTVLVRSLNLDRPWELIHQDLLVLATEIGRWPVEVQAQ